MMVDYHLIAEAAIFQRIPIPAFPVGGWSQCHSEERLDFAQGKFCDQDSGFCCFSFGIRRRFDKIAEE
jgi:hypothetical protein